MVKQTANPLRFIISRNSITKLPLKFNEQNKNTFETNVHYRFIQSCINTYCRFEKLRSAYKKYALCFYRGEAFVFVRIDSKQNEQ